MAPGTDGFIETERKYEAGPAFVLPDLAGVAGVAAVTGQRTHRLRAVYFDTADLRLAAARITLRRRTGGTDAGWHLKLPAGVDSRREVHAPLTRAARTVPASLAARVAGSTAGEPLAPIARLETARTVRYLTGQDGQPLAEVADDLVTGALPEPAPEPAQGRGGRPRWRVVSRWREIEVELADGTRDLLDAVEGALVQAGAEPSAAASKLSRLLAAAGPPGSGTPAGG
ncbi:MAG TPA: CYTH domain-containing protein [Streptosporangiaceae bacterium]|nr:CYTH domain-containing protein [Streptosporangiaceae bacterium]